MSQLSVRFMLQLQYIPAEMRFLETRFSVFWHCLNVIHFCLWLHLSRESFNINRGQCSRMYVFKSLFCLSAFCLWDVQSICLNTFLERCQNGIDRDQSRGECTYCSLCTHSPHSILGNCSALKKKVVIILSLSVPGDIYSK